MFSNGDRHIPFSASGGEGAGMRWPLARSLRLGCDLAAPCIRQITFMQVYALLIHFDFGPPQPIKNLNSKLEILTLWPMHAALINSATPCPLRRQRH
jgi:hypothetical protein